MALEFNGSTDRVDWANVLNPVGTNFSFSCWLWLDNYTHNNVFFTIHQSGNAAYGMHLYTIATSGYLRAIIHGSTVLVRVGNAELGTGAWHHVVFTWDGSVTGTNSHWYRDGSEIAYGTTVNGITLTGETGSWSIGGRIFDDTVNCDGRIAEPAVWNAILPPAAITGLSSGLSPLWYQNDLVFAPGFVGGSVNDQWSGLAGTKDGTTAADHPRIIYPGRTHYPVAVASAPPAETVVTPDAVSSAWAVVQPTLIKTVKSAVVSTAFATVAPTLLETVKPDPVTAAWAVIAPTLVKTVTPSAVSAAWAVVQPSVPLTVTPSAVSAAWAVVQPTTSAGGVVPTSYYYPFILGG